MVRAQKPTEGAGMKGPRVNRQVQQSSIQLESTGEVLRTLRQRAGLSRDDLAEKAGMASGTLTRYEGNVPTQPNVVSVRAILRVLAEELGRDAEQVWADYKDWLLSTDLADRIAADLYLAAQVRAVLGEAE